MGCTLANNFIANNFIGEWGVGRQPEPPPYRSNRNLERERESVKLCTTAIAVRIRTYCMGTVYLYPKLRMVGRELGVR